ncbi:DNA polymerase alpha subunit B [Taphrina deformans PYCC 5710]|uniref:DNA polymerase alpha subunit B n=1 Tax=Taphrina deformans (strain PYCC 5710 / ATCC 11124 / CBS 356.35 / IMI 108563 / JCM 9778 / NBRC 8474) TaxID=1097556 RepID=R4X757_TAPDE|nr:DNA polymerase alpha subunit B [Taphrina deformans PYCC 5710]|eukprot:CCG81096.1 DNA polymerase alpha subunit B [Taphrina deformans PYCC 5710]
MDRFGEVSVDVQALLESVLKNYTLDAEDLYFKWESWGFKMGNNPPLNIENATLFKQDIQNQLEHNNQTKLRDIAATPASSKKASSNLAAGYGDFLGGGDITPLKRKLKQEPVSTVRKQTALSTPQYGTPVVDRGSQITTTTKNDAATPPKFAMPTPFTNRKEPGTIIQTLDPSNIDLKQFNATTTPALTVNFDPKKYSYRPMYQKLSEVSEILDDQIDQYAGIVLEAFNLQDQDIGNPSLNTQTETVVVGRIVSDSLEGGRLNAASVMLETSRRLGTGSRTKLDLSALQSYALFPGKLIALRGLNAATEFKVSEILEPQDLPLPASPIAGFSKEGTSIIIAAGPYTPNSDLSFEALKALQAVVSSTKPQGVILIGPFVDLTHPMIKSGDIDCEADTLDGVFQTLVAPIIKDFPGLLVIPHINDAISRHSCFPQEPFSRAITSLPKFAKLLPNPALFSLNEVSYGICSNDILKHLTMAEISRNPKEKNGLARQILHIIQQRRFYPLFPGPSSEISSTANLDIGYLGLTELGSSLPDVLISPSEMTTFAKVVNGVIVINPGGLSRKAGAGSYAQLYIQPRNGSEQSTNDDVKMEDDAGVRLNEVWKRSRIDIVRI